MELLKLLSTSEIVAQIASFLLLLFVLRVFAWKKILGLLDARKERIASELKDIENAKLEIAKLKAGYEEKMASVSEEARQKIQAAVEEGKDLQEQLKKAGYLESQKIIEAARANIKYEIAKAREELKERIIDISIKAAESVIEEKLTEKEDRNLVKSFLKRVDEMQ